MAAPHVTYLLPLRAAAPRSDLTDYLASLAAHVDEIVVVDGSDDAVFATHRQLWRGCVTHLPVDVDLRFANGKVNGVLTGLRHARSDVVVIADDDVRYTSAELRRALDELAGADLVIPQNYFDPLPWHARWDTARSLLNRVAGHDYPGTLVVRTAVLRATGGYDGDVLFENLELIRTVAAAGGHVRSAPDLFVRRVPPPAGHFRGQRVRQAYDSLAQPGRLVIELSLLPALVVVVRRWRGTGAVSAAAAAVAVAELGRRRHNGREVFGRDTALLSPAWVVERAVCIWLAVASRVAFGGVRYGGTRIRRAATSRRRLRQRHGHLARPGSGVVGGD